jgi:acyl carrier protein
MRRIDLNHSGGLQMEQSEILTTIETAIRNVVNNQNLTVKVDSRLVEDLGLESIDLLDLSSELENSIGKELDFREVAEYATPKSGGPADLKSIKVSDIIEYIQANP